MARAPEVVAEEGAASLAEAFGTRTLAELREEAVRRRKDALVALMPARGAKLAELFHLLHDKEDPARFGAGLDPSRSLADLSKALIADETLDQALAEFTDKWIRRPNVASQIPVELPPLKPTPPPSPIRRDSTTAEMSEEVAALERELIMPEYRKASSLSQEITFGASGQKASTSGSMTLDDLEDPPLSATSNGRLKSVPNSTTSPFPVTYRSPAFRSGRDSDPTPTTASASNFPDTIENVGLTTVDPSQLVKEEQPDYSSLDLPIRGYPVPYTSSLPPLPENLLKNRLNVGGLMRKKARERAIAMQNPQTASSSSLSTDLYKLGISKANHQSVRTLLGASAPVPGKSRTGSKVVTTSDWNVALAEVQAQRALERIEQLKSDKVWSLRQIRKQRAPGTQKAHWDYLLDEMKWLAVDFRQETRWKMAAAYEISQAVKEWHDAEDEATRAKLCVTTRKPRFLHKEADGETEAEQSEQEAAGDASLDNISMIEPARLSGQYAGEPSSTPVASSSGLPAERPARPKRYQNQLVSARAPIFDLPPTQTVYTLAASALPETYRELASYEVVNELFQDLHAYQAPSEPSSDPRQNRRIDEAHPHYSRITNTAHYLESKPLLVSTLMPSKKRKRSGDWRDMADVAGEEGRDLMTEMFGSIQDIGSVKPKDGGNKRFNPAPPPNAEARSASVDWSPEEDRQLFIFTKQYSFNWDLVAHIFNSATKRSKGDERLPWDCFDRWNKKFAPPTPTPTTAGLPPASAGLPPGQPGTPAMAGGSIASPGQKRDRRTSGTVVAGPGGGLPTPVVAAAPRKPELAKSYIRHVSLVEATKKTQKRREIQQKQNMVPAVRKVNLSSHESHTQPYQPGLTAMDLAKIKADRERLQMEEARKMQQQRMYSQAQAAAMAQQHQLQRGQMALQGQPNFRMPANAMQSMQASQAAMLQNQRQQMGGAPMSQAQLQAAAQAAAMIQQQQQQQGGQSRQMQAQLPQGQMMQRPPSSAGSSQQMQMMNGSGQGSPPLQTPTGLQQANMQIPMQVANQRMVSPNMQAGPPSQSPQNGQMQLSPQQQQLQLQMQQAAQNGALGSPAAQQALMAQFAAAANGNRTGSPMQQMQQLAQQQQQLGQGQPLQLPPNLTPEQTQQFMNYLRMRQSSAASSQGGQ